MKYLIIIMLLSFNSYAMDASEARKISDKAVQRMRDYEKNAIKKCIEQTIEHLNEYIPEMANAGEYRACDYNGCSENFKEVFYGVSKYFKPKGYLPYYNKTYNVCVDWSK